MLKSILSTSFKTHTHGFYITLGGVYALKMRAEEVVDVHFFPCDDQGDMHKADFDIWNESRSSAHLNGVVAISVSKMLWTQVSFETPLMGDFEHFSKSYVRRVVSGPLEDFDYVALSSQTGKILSGKVTKPLTECLIVGAQKSELVSAQNRVLSMGIYPERFEFSVLSNCGELLSFMKAQKMSTPLLFVSIDKEQIVLTILREGKIEATRVLEKGIQAYVQEIQQENAFSTEADAWSLFYKGQMSSSMFDYASMKRLIKEIRDFSAFYEMNFGHSVEGVWTSPLGEQFRNFLEGLPRALDLKEFAPDYQKWAFAHGVSLNASVNLKNIGAAWLSVFGLIDVVKN
jgi:hypothetical protein